MHFTSHSEFENYIYNSSNRYWNASFSLGVKYSLGKLKARVKQTEHVIQNDDIKTDYNE